jgi:hypothetical protein
VRAGNQLVLTFGDGPADPNRRLFAMHRVLDDIPALETLPTPTPGAALIPPSSPTPRQPETRITATPTAPILYTEVSPPLREAPTAGLAIQVGLLPVLLILAGTVIFRFWYKNKS